MHKLQSVKSIINKLMIFLGILLWIIIFFFVIHVYQVNEYNSTERSIDGNTATTEVICDIHPRGLLTDSWEKNDAFPDTIIKAKIYEMTIINSSSNLLEDWSLRININDSCYINNAWNGTVEIHQFSDGKEKEQTLDLRNYNADDIVLDYFMAGQDLLIPLNKGDYIIYHPIKGETGEDPIKSSREFSGEVNSGIIFYSLSGDVDLSSYLMTYYLHKNIFSGVDGLIYLILLPGWFALTFVCGIISGIIVRSEEKLYLQEQQLKDCISLIGKLADAKDTYCEGHSARTAKVAQMIAENMGMDRVDARKVYMAGMVHNVGNHYLPEGLINKTTKLTSDEMDIVKKHTFKGAELVEHFEAMPYAFDAALYHHERVDGSGYPTNKKGDEIPLVAKIIAVADTYDAMSHDRAYRDKYSKEEIREMFIKNSGVLYDSLVVGAFLEILDEIEEL
ncbi:MAG: HD domain-containing protein [Pseudobutyrivibrio sp.]|nr:HD domain-containing protein [Pseudobutyrivibrio sp.]